MVLYKAFVINGLLNKTADGPQLNNAESTELMRELTRNFRGSSLTTEVNNCRMQKTSNGINPGNKHHGISPGKSRPPIGRRLFGEWKI
jgi:hypothetical protein